MFPSTTSTRWPRSRVGRLLAALASAVVLFLGMTSFAASAAALGEVPAPPDLTIGGQIPLHNATAEASTDCPADLGAAWHFVLAPNDGSSAFVSITLNLGTETLTFDGAALVPNAGQLDNVFVAVPAGHELGDLGVEGSWARYEGATPNQFNLSHVCVGTTTTTQPSTTTTQPSTTTTSTSTTSTSTTQPSTTTTQPSTTTTQPSTTTTAPSTTTSVAPTTATSAPPTTGAAEVLAATEVAPVASGASGTLPVTGTDVLGLVAAGMAIVLGGSALAALARQQRS